MSDPPSPDQPQSAQSYAAASRRIEEILAQLEQSERVDVDHLAERVAEASSLIRHCRDRLRETEITIGRIVDELAADAPKATETQGEQGDKVG